VSAPEPPYGPPRPRASVGFRVFLTVVGVLAALLLVAAGAAAFFVYRFTQSPTGSKIVGAVGEMGKAIGEAQSAPGTGPMRALGCAPAMVFDPQKMADIVRDALPDGGAPVPLTVRAYLQCQAPGTPPTCDAVVAAYLRAAPRPPGEIMATVSVSGRKKPECQAVYAPTGARLRTIR
jgi:hypothetical protein